MKDFSNLERGPSEKIVAIFIIPGLESNEICLIQKKTYIHVSLGGFPRIPNNLTKKNTNEL